MTRIAILEGEELGRARLRSSLRRRAKSVSRKYKKISPAIQASRAAKKMVSRTDLDKYAKKIVGDIVIKYGTNLDEKKVKSLAAAGIIAMGISAAFAPAGAKLVWKVYRTQVRNKNRRDVESPKCKSMSTSRKPKSIRKPDKKARLQRKVRVQRAASGSSSSKIADAKTAGIWQKIKDWFSGK